MKLDDAIDAIYDEAKSQGEPLTRDVCERIARQLFGIVYIPSLKPGDIAQNHRKRYEGEFEWVADAESHFQEAAAGAPSK